MDDLNLTHILAEILAQHDVPISEHKDHLKIPGSDMRLEAWGLPDPKPSGISLQLDVHLRSSQHLGNRVLIESFDELGTNLDDAIGKTFYSFSLASLHVLLSAFVDRDLGSGQVDWEQWGTGPRAWNVCLGPLTPKTFGQPTPDKPLLEDLKYEPVLDTLRDAFVSGASHKLHWLRTFRGSLHGECIAREALLDNEPWPAGEALLDGATWPAEPDFYSIRHFLVALPIQQQKKWWERR
jgi:hypothetical protein